MLPKNVNDDKIHHSFSKSLPLGGDWKSKSMRIIPEEIVRSTNTEHRVVFSVRWGNSWQFWLRRDKEGLFMIEEDWNEFVDDNLLGPDHTLFFTHEDTIFFQAKIFGQDEKEIMYCPLGDGDEPEPEPEPVHHVKKQKPHKENVTAFASSSSNGEHDDAHLKTPEEYLLDPTSPYFVQTITKRNDLLYFSRRAIQVYELKFGAPCSTVNYVLPDGGKKKATLKIYRGICPCLNGWSSLCKKNNLVLGDKVVCEVESTSGLVSDVRVHFMR